MVSSTTKLNGVRLGRMIIAGANELASNKQLVDAMNVFPVPDGDTGTNMSLTVMAAAREAEKNGSLQVADIAKAASGGALRGARGNSGVITSQIFRGFAKALEGMEEAGVQELAAAAAAQVSVPVSSVDGQTGAVSLAGTYATPADLTARLNRSTDVHAADTAYTTYMARGEALFAQETTPTVNGAIAWRRGDGAQDADRRHGLYGHGRHGSH